MGNQPSSRESQQPANPASRIKIITRMPVKPPKPIQTTNSIQITSATHQFTQTIKPLTSSQHEGCPSTPTQPRTFHQKQAPPPKFCLQLQQSNLTNDTIPPQSEQNFYLSELHLRSMSNPITIPAKFYSHKMRVLGLLRAVECPVDIESWCGSSAGMSQAWEGGNWMAPPSFQFTAARRGQSGCWLSNLRHLRASKTSVLGEKPEKNEWGNLKW